MTARKGSKRVNNKEQDHAWHKNPWVYAVMLPILITIIGVLFEYIVAKPVENEPTAILARLWSLLWRSAPWAMGVVVLILLIKSIVQKNGRERWSAGWDWITGLSFQFPVTTRNHRMSLARTAAKQLQTVKQLKFDEGYEKHSAEVAAERAAVQMPDWEIRPSEHQGQVDYYLYNYGARVSRVRLTAPSEYFDFEGFDPRFPDPFEGQVGGGYSGKHFSGEPTDSGMSAGVDFTIRWVDKNGDPQEEVKRVAPERLKRSAVAAARNEKAR